MAIGVVVNPAAGGGHLGAAWPAVRAELERSLGALAVLETARHGDGRTLAAQHVRAGVDLVIAVGGDGTANECAEGVLEVGGSAALGIVSLGTGRDFLRSVADRRDSGAAIAAIASGRSRRIDAGRVTFTGPTGQTETRHFINVASLGLSARIAARVNAIKRERRVLNARATFYIETIKGIMGYRPEVVRVRFDDGETIELETALVAVGNGRYFGGGMMVLPEARLDDGLLDVLIYRAPGMLRMIGDFNLIYRGAHTRLERVRMRRCRWVEVSALHSAPGAMLEIDGESPGRIPARFEIVPGALMLRG